MSFKAIGKRIKKASTTVSREVFNRRIVKESSLKWLDNKGLPIDGQDCPRLKKAPFICNGCDNRKRCSFVQKSYYAGKRIMSTGAYLCICPVNLEALRGEATKQSSQKL